MMHSVNDNVNNNKMQFIIFHGQINALEGIIWNEGWSNIIQTMYHWVQRCHHEPQLAGTNVLSNYASVTSGYCIVCCMDKEWVSTLTLSQSWPTAIQASSSFSNTTSLLFFAKSKSTQVIRIIQIRKNETFSLLSLWDRISRLHFWWMSIGTPDTQLWDLVQTLK